MDGYVDMYAVSRMNQRPCVWCCFAFAGCNGVGCCVGTSGNRHQEGGDGVLRVQAEADTQGPPHLHHSKVLKSTKTTMSIAIRENSSVFVDLTRPDMTWHDLPPVSTVNVGFWCAKLYDERCRWTSRIHGMIDTDTQYPYFTAVPHGYLEKHVGIQAVCCSSEAFIYVLALLMNPVILFFFSILLVSLLEIIYARILTAQSTNVHGFERSTDTTSFLLLFFSGFVLTILYYVALVHYTLWTWRHSTPSKPVHCIVWAKQLFILMFGKTEESMLYEDPVTGESAFMKQVIYNFEMSVILYCLGERV